MAGVADWLVVRRPARVALLAATFPLPLLSVLSAALVVLTTNARGWRIAVQDCIMAAVLVAAFAAATGGYWLQLGTGALVTWLVVTLLGELRRSASLTLSVQCAILLGVLGALSFTLWSQDPDAYWEKVLQDWASRARTAGFDVGPVDVIPGAAQLMTGVMSASAVASALASLFIGCWWAGTLTGRHFGPEFEELRMGRVMGLMAGAVGVAFLTPARPTADDLLLVLALGFLLQGLAVVHWHGARRAWPRAWPAALYLPLALLPVLAAVEMAALALVGLVDNGYGLRRIGGKVV